MTPVTRERPTVTVGAISIEPIVRGAVPAGVRTSLGPGSPADARARRGPTGPTGNRVKNRNPALMFALLGSAMMSYTALRVGEILVSDLLFLLAAVAIVGKSLTGNDADLAPPGGRRGSSLVLIGALLLLTAGTLSSLRSWDPSGSMKVVLRFAWVTLVWFWILRTVCRDRADFYRVLRAWKLSSVLTAAAAVLGYMGIAFISEQAGNRQVGLATHPNHLAGHLGATFVLFLLAVPREEGMPRRRARVWWLASLALCSTALFASGSISGLLSITTAMLVVAAVFLVTRTPRSTRRRSPLAPLAVLAVLMAGTTALLTSDLPVVDRITRFREGDTYVTASVDSRGSRNSLVTDRFDEYLVVGLGFNHESLGVTRSNNPDDPAVRSFGVHNMYLGMLYQAGLAAVIGVAIVLIAACRQLAALLRRTDAELYLTTLALVGSLTAVITTSMFQPTGFDRFFWMPVAMTGCLWSVRRRELRDAAASSEQRVPAPAD
jgi:hypothetical protein